MFSEVDIGVDVGVLYCTPIVRVELFKIIAAKAISVRILSSIHSFLSLFALCRLLWLNWKHIVGRFVRWADYTEYDDDDNLNIGFQPHSSNDNSITWIFCRITWEIQQCATHQGKQHQISFRWKIGKQIFVIKNYK